MQCDELQLKQIIEACLFVEARAMTIKELKEGVLKDFNLSSSDISALLQSLADDFKGHGVELNKVAGGYRFQTLEKLSPHLQHLWQKKTPKYSRAVLETLAVIAYKQPVTRGDVEQVRGVAVSSQILKTLQDRNWIRGVGYKEVPGRPALYATTTEFLAYFGLDTLADLPPLTDPKSLQALFSNERQALTNIEESN